MVLLQEEKKLEDQKGSTTYRPDNAYRMVTPEK